MNWRIEKDGRDWYCITPQGWSVCCGTWEDARDHYLQWSAQWAETERDRQVNLVETIVDALWEGFETVDGSLANRTMELIHTFANFNEASMAKIAEHVIEALRLTAT